MIVNGQHLLAAMPIKGMVAEKRRLHGVSYGLSEAGYDIRIKQSITMSPEHRFTLASTIEEFQMPADLVGVVHDKSTFARLGLSALNTVVEPSWCGFLTLELVYHGNCELHIPAGSGIAQVLFSRIQADAHYDGKYQGQADMPIEARFDQ